MHSSESTAATRRARASLKGTADIMQEREREGERERETGRERGREIIAVAVKGQQDSGSACLQEHSLRTGRTSPWPI